MFVRLSLALSLSSILLSLPYLECAKGGAQEVCGTEIPQWGPGAKPWKGVRPPEADAVLLTNA